jgi:hypothetical protein
MQQARPASVTTNTRQRAPHQVTSIGDPSQQTNQSPGTTANQQTTARIPSHRTRPRSEKTTKNHVSTSAGETIPIATTTNPSATSVAQRTSSTNDAVEMFIDPGQQALPAIELTARQNDNMTAAKALAEAVPMIPAATEPTTATRTTTCPVGLTSTRYPQRTQNRNATPPRDKLNDQSHHYPDRARLI